jgi:hypothetical protein
MTLLAPQPAPAVRAQPSALTAPFWDACSRHELIHQRCRACGLANFDPSERCRRCLALDLEWEHGAGRGVIATWTVVWRPVVASYEVPYAVAVVAMDEGFHIVTNIVGCDHADVASGMRVAVTFHTDSNGFTLPIFRPDGDQPPAVDP